MAASEEFERGVAAGEIAQRLREHDRHFAQINGHLSSVADQLSGLRLEVQRLADAMMSDRTMVASTAVAVEKERKATASEIERQRTALRDAGERRWSPLVRLGIAMGIAVPLAGLAVWLVSHLH